MGRTRFWGLCDASDRATPRLCEPCTAFSGRYIGSHCLFCLIGLTSIMLANVITLAVSWMIPLQLILSWIGHLQPAGKNLKEIVHNFAIAHEPGRLDLR